MPCFGHDLFVMPMEMVTHSHHGDARGLGAHAGPAPRPARLALPATTC